MHESKIDHGPLMTNSIQLCSGDLGLGGSLEVVASIELLEIIEGAGF